VAGIKNTFIDKILKEKKISFSKNKNFYVYVYINVENGVGVFNINNNIERTVSLELAKHINKLKYKNVVLICRSDKEQFSEAFPNSAELNYLENNIKRNVKIFYQEPWPSHVPNFIEDNETLYIRFGYDEGSEFDKLCVNDSNFKTTQADGEYWFLLNNINNKLIY
jgi:hypothetical protein